MNFSAVDLNLLRIFSAMMVELNTTRAGERVGLSQPAVSSALGRLRHVLGDELFVREGNRMVPTPRALMLREPICEALRRIEDALSASSRFDPATAKAAFRIGGSDFVAFLLMPRLAAAVGAQAPGVTLQMLPNTGSDVPGLLGSGAIDLAVFPRIEAPDWVRSRRLFQSHTVVLAPKDHPMLVEAGVRPGERIPAELFCAIPQVRMSIDGAGAGGTDQVLAEHGCKRRVVVTVPHFPAVALAVARADLVGSLPVHVARRAARIHDLDLYLPPFDPPVVDVMLFWHRRLEDDPANVWLRRQMVCACDFAPCEMTAPAAVERGTNVTAMARTTNGAKEKWRTGEDSNP